MSNTKNISKTSFALIILFLFLTACSSIPVPKTPTAKELVGTYRLFAGSEISYGISEKNGNLSASLLRIAPPEQLQKLSPIHYKLGTGDDLRFNYSLENYTGNIAELKYDRFTTLSEGRQQEFVHDDVLQRSRKQVTNQAIYTNQIQSRLRAGGYAYSRFISPSRGLVDYSIYLPQEWRRNSKKSYPLVIFLHGQTGWEHSFPESVPAKQLNQWVAEGRIPPMVIVSLRAGRLKANVEEHWTTPRNENLLTSKHPTELRAFIRQQFRAGLSPKTTAIHGHSRGSRGAIHYALKYPTRFSSAVANSFVSDYALNQTKQIAQKNAQQIRQQGIPLRISIGDQDEFAVNMGRRASPVIHDYLNRLRIPHDYEVFRGVNHGFVNVWNTKMRNGITNGLAELQLHAGAWTR